MTDPLTPGPTPAPPTRSVRSLIGGFLMVLGILWMLLCGACTLLVGLFNVASLSSGSGGGDTLLVAAIIGLVGAVPGIIMYFVGRALRRP